MGGSVHGDVLWGNGVELSNSIAPAPVEAGSFDNTVLVDCPQLMNEGINEENVSEIAKRMYNCQNTKDTRDWIKYMVVPLVANLGISSGLGRRGLEKLFGEIHGNNNKECGIEQNMALNLDENQPIMEAHEDNHVN